MIEDRFLNYPAHDAVPEETTKPQLVPVDETTLEQLSPIDIPTGTTVSCTSGARELKADKIVDAWDKIGVLTNEMTMSVMKKQADLVAKRYRTSVQSKQGPLQKKRRLEDANATLSARPEENWSRGLTRCVDRMARMSKLIMEMEYCHRLLRETMVEIQEDLCS